MQRPPVATTEGRQNELPVATSEACDLSTAQAVPETALTLFRWIWDEADTETLVILADASADHRVQDLGLTEKGNFQNHAFRWPEQAELMVKHVDRYSFKEM
ncbi:hypothetical protein SUDANB21_05308 [Streptomyces sp. enrichment culture]